MVRGLPAALFAGLALACASPTLPLPPPSQEPTQSAGIDADHVSLNAPCGSVPANVWVDVVNIGHPGGTPIPSIDTGTIVIATSCGAYTASVYGHAQDVLEITYQEDIQVSTPQIVTIGGT